ncbi:MAG TPA: protein kinase [Nocardioidaceae bacterium]
MNRHSLGTHTGLGQRYRLDRRIATGGMGEVWAATDTLLERPVAVKVLKHEYADDATFRRRFESEARNAGALQHPHVASVFDFGELPDADGSGDTRPFLVMELVPGQPLSAILRQGVPMPPSTAADLIAQAADGIAAAHALGIVHRDVKPGNLLVTPEGQVKITDFGIARAAGNVALTRTGQLVGTPHYLSPEQAEGRSATEASDIYALGVVLYECLAGRRPFSGETPVTTALAHLRDDPPPLPDEVPAQLKAVVATAMAKDPARRFPDAAAMAAALRGDEAPATTAVPAPTVVGSPDPTLVDTAPARAGAGRTRRLPPWWPWAAAAVVLLLVAGAFALGSGGDAQSPAAEPRTSPSAGSGTPRQLLVRRSALVGMDVAEAQARLERRGFDVSVRRRENLGGQEEGTVATVRPFGRVDPGSTITLTAWGPEPAPTPDAKPPKEPKEKKPPKEPKDHGKGHAMGEKPGKAKGKG